MNSQISIIKQYTSVEDYIEHSFNTFKLKNPKLTKRQIHIQLQDKWKKEQQKYLSIHTKKEQNSINKLDEDYEIYIPIEALNNETQIKTNKKKNQNKKSTSKNKKQQQQNLSKSFIIKNNTDSSQYSFDINSLEERVSKIQIDEQNLSKTKPSKNLCRQQINKTNESINNYQNKKNNKKQKKVTFKQSEKISQTIDYENVSNEKPIPIQDFINSANFIDHISIIKISKNKTNQGQIEIDKIKTIVSHTYGLVNHYKDTSNLNLQLFFQVEFHPRSDGTQPDNTFCTAKQAALYNKDLVLDYLNKNKNIFTQDCEYYIN
ncbi:unnamed protein product [Paramecium pentaurelia]|uniref:Uncharacterized protein n=1 Tax=Paramecium pentaurelia TaxID=43138 RepID=A0A8S1U8V3_9CILI|nr:unnamed protein product [Paramecium pentaurelia]